VARGSASQAAIASCVNQTVRLPRWRKPASYSAQFVIRRRCFGIRWRRAALALNGIEDPGSSEGPSSYASHTRVPTARSVQQTPFERHGRAPHDPEIPDLGLTEAADGGAGHAQNSRLQGHAGRDWDDQRRRQQEREPGQLQRVFINGSGTADRGVDARVERPRQRRDAVRTRRARSRSERAAPCGSPRWRVRPQSVRPCQTILAPDVARIRKRGRWPSDDAKVGAASSPDARNPMAVRAGVSARQQALIALLSPTCGMVAVPATRTVVKRQEHVAREVGRNGFDRSGMHFDQLIVT
jgi:hypothetical protein